MKRIQSKTTETTRRHRLRHYSLLGFFSDPQWQLIPQAAVGSGCKLNSFKLLCMSLLPASMKITRRYEKDPIKNSRKTWRRLFPPIISQWEIYVAIETRVIILIRPKTKCYPNYASDKILLQYDRWSRRYSCFKVFTQRRGRRLPRSPSYKLTFWDFVYVS